MYKKITNGKIYDLANYIVSEQTYMRINSIYSNEKGKNVDRGFTPVFEIDMAKEILGVNDNLEFIEEYKGSSEIKEIISDVYELLAKNQETSRELADYYFTNRDYQNSIGYFIYRTLDYIAYELSGSELTYEQFRNSGSERTLDKFDPESKAINKIIDERINEFVLNFTLHNN